MWWPAPSRHSEVVGPAPARGPWSRAQSRRPVKTGTMGAVRSAPGLIFIVQAACVVCSPRPFARQGAIRYTAALCPHEFGNPWCESRMSLRPSERRHAVGHGGDVIAELTTDHREVEGLSNSSRTLPPAVQIAGGWWMR